MATAGDWSPLRRQRVSASGTLKLPAAHGTSGWQRPLTNHQSRERFIGGRSFEGLFQEGELATTLRREPGKNRLSETAVGVMAEVGWAWQSRFEFSFQDKRKVKR